MEHSDDFNINHEYICRYIRRTLSPSEYPLGEMEKYAKTHDVPIAQPETMRFLEVLIKASGVEKVLEVGSAIGYSAIAMAKCGAHVTPRRTIKSDGFMQTLKIWLKMVTVVAGDVNILRAYGRVCVFLDAAKGHYMNFLPIA